MKSESSFQEWCTVLYILRDFSVKLFTSKQNSPLVELEHDTVSINIFIRLKCIGFSLRKADFLGKPYFSPNSLSLNKFMIENESNE
jgi:hypothetical protein